MLDFGGLHPGVLLNTILRSFVVYVAVLAALRLAGKRHVGQLSIVDFVLVLLVSNSVQNAMVGSDTSLAGGLVAAITLIAVNLLLTRLVLRNTRLGSVLEGEPALLVRNGRIIEPHLAREGIRPAELEAAIREHGFENVGQCRTVIQEIDGSISVVPYDPDAGKQKKTAKDNLGEHHLPPLPSRRSRHRRAGRRGGRPGQ
jgi:uncharacterized membrane protein YcaP (DUF421 family)